MPTTADSPQLNILHVLTLNGRNGEYGGPVRVARELCQELNSRGHQTHIFSGALVGSEPTPITELSESFIHVRPITQKLKVSSLWSWKLIPPLKKLISNSDLVHIHFARDLISFLAAFLAIILRKPFITQTHGMIISDGRTSTRITDLFLTKRLINKSRTLLVLTEKEMYSIKKLNVKPAVVILPNGIAVNYAKNLSDISSNRVVFCSRLDKRKGIDKFIDLADSFRHSNLVFEIYGPDGGELDFCENEIKIRCLQKTLSYEGALTSDKVQEMLADAKLLILPSKNEPFPMVVLESLAVGTPVLVMPSCGLAAKLKQFDQYFVSSSEDLCDIINTFKMSISKNLDLEARFSTREFVIKEFSIISVVDTLLETYEKTILSHLSEE